MTTITRQTKETHITLELDVFGDGTCEAKLGHPFMEHMLTSLCKYSGMRLRVEATGDLEHHLIEDVAIVLGQAFKEDFANRPCARMAHDIIAMDDALILTVVDLVDRPYYQGELPLPIYEHVLRSFATEARINLHVDVLRGRDAHHIIEGAFKGLGRCLKVALQPRDDVLSTKGSVRYG